jgi:hypothetical protein
MSTAFDPGNGYLPGLMARMRQAGEAVRPRKGVNTSVHAVRNGVVRSMASNPDCHDGNFQDRCVQAANMVNTG